MARLYCAEHGSEDETRIAGNQAMYRQEGETVLVVKGTLISGPFVCDRCDARLNPGDAAYLFSAFPSHFHDSLYEYDFGYERGYFAMGKGDTADAYGADWPDGSIRHRRSIGREPKRRPEPV
jgi:hypothetical protein